MILLERVGYAVLGICVAYPWINPFSSGPSSTAATWHTAGVMATTIAIVLFFLLRSKSLLEWPKSMPKVLAWAVFAAAALNAAIGIVQWFGYELMFYPLMAYSENGIPVGNTRQRNLFGVLNVMGLMSAFYLSAEGSFGISADRRPLLRHLMTLVLVFMGLTAGLALSRTGLLIAVCFAVVVVFRRRTTSSWSLLASYAAGFALAVVISMLPAEWLGLVSQDLSRRFTDWGGSGRSILYSNMWAIAQQNPWFGVGWQSLAGAHFSMDYEALGLSRYPGLVDHAHNLPLHIAVAIGIPAAIAFTLALAWTIFWLYVHTHRSSETFYLFALLFAVLSHSFLEYPLWIGGPALLLVCVLSLLMLNLRRKNDGLSLVVSPSFLTGGRMLLFLLALVLGSMSFWAIQDYKKLTDWISASESALKQNLSQPTEPKINFYLHHVQRQTFLASPPHQGQWLNQLTHGMELRQWSAEPQVIERVLALSLSLDMNRWAASELARYQNSFPAEAQAWLKRVKKANNDSMANSGVASERKQ